MTAGISILIVYITGALFFVISGIWAVQPGPEIYPTRGSVWPRPQNVTSGVNSYIYNPSLLKFMGDGEECPLILKALNRYKGVLKAQSAGPEAYYGYYYGRSDNNSTLPILTKVELTFYDGCEINPFANADESYKLIISSVKGVGVCNIRANSVWGILRGLETFSQLSYFNGTVNELRIEEVKITDYPRFSHRGLMIDTSRHYLLKSTIKTILDAMECNKLNVLHWHMVDDQSFPYQSRKFPSLSEKGAYRPYKIYTEGDIVEIIKYASLRGIRVIPEFDTPGHTQSWGLGKPGLLTKCYSGSEPNGNYGPVDPSNSDNYDFLEELFTEVSSIFPDSHFHFGGDEVDFSCWMSNKKINEFMESKGFPRDYVKLESYYIAKILDIAEKLKVIPIVWQEVFLNNKTLSQNTTVHIWTGNMNSLLSQATYAGYNVLLSTCWYLDQFSQDIYAGGGDWQRFYNCEPLDFTGTPDMKKRVIGGEACMWAEFVDDTNIIQRVWPRASAAAERLWSSDFDEVAAQNRLEEHVCRMRSRGVMAQPPNGPSTC